MLGTLSEGSVLQLAVIRPFNFFPRNPMLDLPTTP
jgi:hypothetical protein